MRQLSAQRQAYAQGTSNPQVDSQPVVAHRVRCLLLVETVMPPSMLLGEVGLLEEYRAAAEVWGVINSERGQSAGHESVDASCRIVD